jgi:hypothetical protein
MNTLAVALAGSLVLAGTAWSKDAVPACGYSEEPLEVPTPAPKRNRLQLLGSTPASGEAVHPATVAGVDVEYHIVDFAPGRYELVLHAAGHAPGSTSIIGDGAQGKHLLANAHGKVHLCAPLRPLFGAEGVRWPLLLHVSLQKRTGPTSFTLYAQTARLQFPSPDLSKKMLEQQKSIRSETYYMALDAVFDFRYRNEYTYNACVERFPETLATLQAPHKDWSERNAALFTRIDALQMQRFTEFVRGTDRTAEASMKSAREDFAEYLERQSDVAMRRLCAELPLVLGGEAREYIGHYLTLMDAEAPSL